ncbi:hypothetical protein SLEP1_g25629 [Rubroshorea leprosula]|uniref:Receptor-like protein 12 n=1 Tax=Rubroshorea leprosula TaxID=152421 RepID=A0AAV5JJP6_9ROSI|nr:hypothetical protein SLEP1_g25629 [Rubroshorea leprosula]
MSLHTLNLSYNFLTGIDSFGFGKLETVDLRSNLLQGSLPILSTTWYSMQQLFISGNDLNGEIPSSYCNMTSLRVLDLAYTSLGGKIPECLGNLRNLTFLDLWMNKFHGRIPNSFVDKSELRTLTLNGNQLEADKLEYIGEEHYIGDEQYIGNKYYPQRCAPRRCPSRHPFYYKDSVKVVMKGSERELVRILKIFTTIDFSSNQFHGLIPEELGELNSLLLLNLSHNSLNGQIPSSLGKLVELESLDLSSNKLEGGIPAQLTDLTFLSALNLSHNELVGHIPEGRQFNTFSNDSYIGNSRLCGFPLTKKCHNEKEPGAPPSQFDEKDDSTALFEWKFALAGYGCGLVLGLSLGYNAFTTGNPWWVVKKVEKYQQKLIERCKQKHEKRKTQKPNQRF